MSSKSAFAHPTQVPARTNRVIVHDQEAGLVYWRAPKGRTLHPAGHLQDILDEDGAAAVQDAARRWYAGLTRR